MIRTSQNSIAILACKRACAQSGLRELTMDWSGLADPSGCWQTCGCGDLGHPQNLVSPAYASILTAMRIRKSCRAVSCMAVAAEDVPGTTPIASVSPLLITTNC